MFRKIYTKARIYRKLTLTTPYWIKDKKVVTDSNTHLSDEFDTIQLHTSKYLSFHNLSFHNLNKHKWWK